jgi:hypothetical protein
MKKNKIAKGKMGKTAEGRRREGVPFSVATGKSAQTRDGKEIALPYGAQGVRNYMKKQGLDVGDEKRVGGEAWWLSCCVLSNSLAHTIDSYPSRMDVLDARVPFFVECPGLGLCGATGLWKAENPCAKPVGEAPSRPPSNKRCRRGGTNALLVSDGRSSSLPLIYGQRSSIQDAPAPADLSAKRDDCCLAWRWIPASFSREDAKQWRPVPFGVHYTAGRYLPDLGL